MSSYFATTSSLQGPKVLLLDFLLTYYLRTTNLMCLVEGEGELVFTKHPQTITRENRRKTKKSNTFALTFSPRSLRVTSQIKLNPPSSPYCLDWTQCGLLLRRLHRLTHFDSHRKCKHVCVCIFCEPSHPVGADGSAHQSPW